MSEYNELLKEIRTKAEGFFRSTSKEYIPKMYLALRNENPNHTPYPVLNLFQHTFVLNAVTM